MLSPEKVEGTEKSIFGATLVEKTTSAVALILTLFHLYTGAFGSFTSLIQRGVHLGLAMMICFLTEPMTKKMRRGFYTDWIFMALSAVTTGYIVVMSDFIMLNPGVSSTVALVLGVCIVFLLLEASRRLLGLVFPILVFLVLLYTFLGAGLPGLWGHRPFSFNHIMENIYLGTTGIWGTTMGTSATVIAGFMILGSVLLKTGGGKNFIDVALFLGGRFRGGAAKVAIIGSSLFGMINGSSPANAAAVGTFTIPMMKSVGYPAAFAGAVEAIASTGGQIMPPVMGAAAFILAEYVGMPYIEVAAAAALPAILYYLCCFMGVDFFAAKKGIGKVSDEDIQTAGKALNFKGLLPILLPAGVLIGLLMIGRTPDYSVFWSIATAIVLFLLMGQGNMREKLRTLLTSLIDGGKSIVIVAVLLGSAQIVIGLISLTGIGLKVTSMIISLSNAPLLGLALTALVVIILGMGVPTTAAYVLGAAVAAPALTGLGFETLPVHLFIFYYACLSAITPPVCASCYVTAGIAQANWVEVAFQSCRLGIATFIVPFAFCFGPELVLAGSVGAILISFTTACIGVISISSSIIGWLFRANRWWENIVLFGAGTAMITTNIVASLTGIVLFALICVFQKSLKKEKSLA